MLYTLRWCGDNMEIKSKTLHELLMILLLFSGIMFFLNISDITNLTKASIFFITTDIIIIILIWPAFSKIIFGIKVPIYKLIYIIGYKVKINEDLMFTVGSRIKTRLQIDHWLKEKKIKRHLFLNEEVRFLSKKSALHFKMVWG